MDELVKFIRARLAEEEPAKVCGCLDTNHWPPCSPQPWKDRERREIAVKRAVLAWYADSVDCAELFREKLGTGTHMATAAESYLNVIRGYAAIWCDHPDYKQEWARPLA